MVVDCWCGSWGRVTFGGEVMGLWGMVVGLWRSVMGLWRRVVGLWRIVVGLWRRVMGLWVMIVGFWMIVWWEVGRLWYMMRLCWVCWDLVVFGRVWWTVVTFRQVYRTWRGLDRRLSRSMRVPVNWSWAVH